MSYYDLDQIFTLISRSCPLPGCESKEFMRLIFQSFLFFFPIEEKNVVSKHSTEDSYALSQFEMEITSY